MPKLIRCDHCGKEATFPPSDVYMTAPAGWIETTERKTGPDNYRAFCSWPCVLVYTGNRIAELGREQDANAEAIAAQILDEPPAAPWEAPDTKMAEKAGTADVLEQAPAGTLETIADDDIPFLE